MAFTNTNVPAMWQDLVSDVRTAAQGALYTLGQAREENGKRYRYVKFDNGTGNVAAVAANVCYWTATAGQVTSDESDSLVPAGIFVAVIADLGFGWIQTYGVATINTDGDDDIALGDALIHSTTDGGVTRINASEFTTTAATLAQAQRVVKVMAYALAADSDANNNVAGFLVLD